MNLFDLHSKPKTLKGYEQRFDVPELAHDELKKRNYKVKAKSMVSKLERYPDLEPGLLKDPWYAYEYAVANIRGRWPEAEPIIATHNPTAYRYATEVLHHAFPEAEPTIAKSPQYTYWYAVNVLQKRFPLGEPILENSMYWKIAYKKYFKMKL